MVIMVTRTRKVYNDAGGGRETTITFGMAFLFYFSSLCTFLSEHAFTILLYTSRNKISQVLCCYLYYVETRSDAETIRTSQKISLFSSRVMTTDSSSYSNELVSTRNGGGGA